MTKKILLAGICLVLIFTLASCSPASPPVQQAQEPVAEVNNDESETELTNLLTYPSVVVDPSRIMLDRRSEFIIAGAGFPPNQEILLLTKEAEGVITDVTVYWGLSEEQTAAGELLTTDNNGAFLLETMLDRLDSVLEPGVYPLWVKVDGVEVVVPMVYYAKPKD